MGEERAYNRAWREAHKAEVKLYEAAYRKEHRAQRADYMHKWHALRAEHAREYRRGYNAMHREQNRQQMSLWRASHREHEREYGAAHRGDAVSRQRAYRRKHPEKIKAKKARHAARRRGLPATLTDSQWRSIKAAYDHRCAYCGERKERLTQDHVIPSSKGGGTTPGNIVPACRSCNSRKGTRFIPGLPLRKAIEGMFENYIRSGFPIIWVTSVEPARVESELATVAKSISGTTVLHWDIVGGLRPLGQTDGQVVPPPQVPGRISAMQGTVCFLWNFHRFLGSIEVVQAVQNAIPRLKAAGSCLVILAPDTDKVPSELARHVTVSEFPLPSKDALAEILDRVAQDADLPIGYDCKDSLVEAALGLTAAEAEDAFALSVAERHAFFPAVVAREKAGALLRQAKIEMSTFTERFEGLGGLDVVKEYTLAAARSPMSLGILLLGPPGTGKSHFAKALGNELAIPTLSLDFGRLMGSLVGQSEGNVRAALQAIDAMQKCVLFLDEVEKGLAGVQSSGQLDSGVKAGVGAAFLKWMSDRKPGLAYVVATCNDITQLPPEYTRSGRFDATFWLDLPTAEEREVIWHIYEEKYQVTGTRPKDDGWTGAEIFSCCRTAVMLNCDLRQAGEYIIPMSKTMAEKIEALRDWAKGRAVPASRAPTPVSGRRIAR